MATVDRAHRVGFALVPALGGALATIGICAAAGANPDPWGWLAGLAAGVWGYHYAHRWTTGPAHGPGARRSGRAEQQP
ncbi:hypothetical protein [Streptomyces sp. NBC_00470]|uniref:hypothetical protein n=1 Tax=Streptomyces sp. NBC_00470 TaxID=2975753 RepID=UPI002F9128EF